MLRKRCATCAEVKPLTEFHRDRGKSDGHASTCKACKALYDSDYRDQHRARRAAQKRAEAQRYPERRRARIRRYERRHPEKLRAKATLNRAVCAGRVAKPERCERCGSKPRPIDLHGHHADYSKPLEVEWLCRPCHEAEHHPQIAETPRRRKDFVDG